MLGRSASVKAKVKFDTGHFWLKLTIHILADIPSLDGREIADCKDLKA
jgi:hypothetical protein